MGHIEPHLLKRFPSSALLLTFPFLSSALGEAPPLLEPEFLNQQHFVQTRIQKDHPVSGKSTLPSSELLHHLLQCMGVGVEGWDYQEDLFAKVEEGEIFFRVFTFAKIQLLFFRETLVKVAPGIVANLKSC